MKLETKLSVWKLETNYNKNRWLLKLIKSKTKDPSIEVGSEYLGDELLISEIGVVLRKNRKDVFSLGPLL